MSVTVTVQRQAVTVETTETGVNVTVAPVAAPVVTVAPGVTDHGLLGGLADDDHPQYLNQARADARYVVQGSAGSGNDLHYRHVQGAAASVWTITHNLNKYASVMVRDSAGDLVTGQVAWPSLNTITVTFSAPFSGEAYVN